MTAIACGPREIDMALLYVGVDQFDMHLVADVQAIGAPYQLALHGRLEDADPRPLGRGATIGRSTSCVWVTRIEPHGGGTRITQSLEYRVKFGPLGWLLDQIVMKRKLTATLDAVFASLVRHAEGSATSGEPMGRS